MNLNNKAAGASRCQLPPRQTGRGNISDSQAKQLILIPHTATWESRQVHAECCNCDTIVNMSAGQAVIGQNGNQPVQMTVNAKL